MFNPDPVRPNPVRLFKILRKPEHSTRDDIKIGDVATLEKFEGIYPKLVKDTWSQGYALFPPKLVQELDPVRRKIKSGLSQYYNNSKYDCHSYMKEYEGKTYVVESENGNFVTLKEKENPWRWHKDLLEYVPLTSEPQTPNQKPLTSQPENGMRKLDFTAKREIPTTGHVMAIRNKRMYSYNHHTKIFKVVFGSETNNFHADSLLDTDILYNFPTPETPYEYVVKGKCLDEFKIKTDDAKSIKKELIKLLKGGAFITRNESEILKLKNDNVIQGFRKDGAICSSEMMGFEEFDFHQYNNEFEMFAVLYQKS